MTEMMERADLPQTLVELSDYIGVSSALAFARYYGGRRIYVSATPDAELIEVLGASVAAQFCDAYHGASLDVPRLAHRDRLERDAEICRRLAAGALAADITGEYGITERTLRRIRRRNGDRCPLVS